MWILSIAFKTLVSSKKHVLALLIDANHTLLSIVYTTMKCPPPLSEVAMHGSEGIL